MNDATPSVPTIADIAAEKNLYLAKVIWLRHWTADLFSFKVERPQSFRFRSGEFVMIGLDGPQGRPLMRAYSIVSPSWEDHLEFFSVKVADGALTSRLQHVEIGDHILVGRKPTGTLVIDALLPGKNLLMVGTGTGLAPFLSILRDPDTFDKFNRVIITHTVRSEEELAYRTLLEHDMKTDEVFADLLRDRFDYYPTVTRGAFRTPGRITDRIREGLFRADLGLTEDDRGVTRTMICGSTAFNRDMSSILTAAGGVEGTHSIPGTFVIERAFVG